MRTIAWSSEMQCWVVEAGESFPQIEEYTGAHPQTQYALSFSIFRKTLSQNQNHLQRQIKLLVRVDSSVDALIESTPI
jgi:hypothetical protein